MTPKFSSKGRHCREAHLAAAPKLCHPQPTAYKAPTRPLLKRNVIRRGGKWRGSYYRTISLSTAPLCPANLTQALNLERKS